MLEVTNILDKGLNWNEKVEQELEALKDITNKILAPQERYIEFQNVSKNNDSSIPIISASVDKTTYEEVQEGEHLQEEMVYDNSDKAKDNNDANLYSRDRQ
ncbi:hypothetical protein F8M41_010964 [Gigaspora margarita]|uniref:Uncharacterized protein n=1 Tax=Gigaspora margarita TaxID=4874 RepID=A0A8H4A1Y9_GIGMA|nr:hypothetical protein F8M41_010964 [Gigaspora margarita]